MGNSNEPSTPASRKEQYRKELHSQSTTSQKIEEKERNEVILEEMLTDLKVASQKLGREKRSLEKTETVYCKEISLLAQRASDDKSRELVREKAKQIATVRKSSRKIAHSQNIITTANQTIADAQRTHQTARALQITVATVRKINKMIDPAKMATLSREAQKEFFISKSASEFIEETVDHIAEGSDDSENEEENEIISKIYAEFNIALQSKMGPVPSERPSQDTSTDVNQGEKVQTPASNNNYDQDQDFYRRVHNLRSVD